MIVCGRGVFFFQAEDGIRDLVRSRGLGDVYKRQVIRIVLPRSSMEAPCGDGDAAHDGRRADQATVGLSLIHI